MKEKKKSELQLVQETVQKAIGKVNGKIEELGEHANDLYQALADIQELFDTIRNVPSEQLIKYTRLKSVRSEWKQQVNIIENDYRNAVAKGTGAGAAGAGLGVAVMTMGPTAAMGVATTFGVASTGTAISTLSGAAATNAALAWLGGGALAAGGGGMAAGEAFLTLAGPVGWAIAGTALLATGLVFWKSRSEKKRLENVYIAIGERDIGYYEAAFVELNERISRIIDETQKLENATVNIRAFGLDYNRMTEAQQYELGAYVNLMLAATQLLINPILGLKQKYSESDFSRFMSWSDRKADEKLCSKFENIIISLANLLYKITMDDLDKKLFQKAMRSNKKMLKFFDVSRKEFNKDIMNAVYEALEYLYQIT